MAGGYSHQRISPGGGGVPVSDDAMKPHGVSLAEIRECLHFEVASGRGPGSPARIEMERCVREQGEARPRNTKAWGPRR